MVRRLAAKKLGEVAEQFGDEIAKESLVPLWVKLVGEKEVESIRVAAIDSSHAIFKVVSLKEASAAADLYRACASDKSWRVRKAVAESLPNVASSIESARLPEADVQVREACDMFLRLLDDPEREVKHSTASRAATVARTARAASIARMAEFHDELIATLDTLVFDENVPDREKFAEILLDMAEPLGKARAEQVFLQNTHMGVPRLEGLLEVHAAHENPARIVNTLVVVSNLHELIDTLGIDSSEHIIRLLKEELCTHKTWRVRHGAMQLLPRLARLMGQNRFTDMFLEKKETFLDRARDSVALIREDWILACDELGREFGAQWLVDHIVPSLLEAAESSKGNYAHKIVLLDGLENLVATFSSDASLLPTLEKLIELALEMADDTQVPNLRLRAARALGTIGHETAMLGKVTQKLEALKDEDKDPDVREHAGVALAILCPS